MKRILHVVGARPNFMKAAPVHRALAETGGVLQVLVHTGQHYDDGMSKIFFDELDLPRPNHNLEVGSGTHAWQTAEIMKRFEPVLLDEKPDLVLVYGDVNSTIAAALVCAKLLIRVGHVEAGLRSFDPTMPEEINRVLTDRIADYLFTPSPDGDENLVREGIPKEKIHFVGNVMIDTLVRLLPRAEALWPEVSRASSGNTGPLVEKSYGVITLHRPSNTDIPERLRAWMDSLERLSHELPLVFPVHPRTRERLKSLGNRGEGDRLKLLDPIGYLEFLALQQHAAIVITDSGGIQEETTFLGVPCVTVRTNTERPVTVKDGTNTLAGEDPEMLIPIVQRSRQSTRTGRKAPALWDGKAAKRIAAILADAER